MSLVVGYVLWLPIFLLRLYLTAAIPTHLTRHDTIRIFSPVSRAVINFRTEQHYSLRLLTREHRMYNEEPEGEMAKVIVSLSMCMFWQHLISCFDCPYLTFAIPLIQYFTLASRNRFQSKNNTISLWVPARAPDTDTCRSTAVQRAGGG